MHRHATSACCLSPSFETRIANLDHVSFSPDGHRLVAYSLANAGPGTSDVVLFSLESSPIKAAILPHRYKVGVAQFSPDSKLLGVL